MNILNFRYELEELEGIIINDLATFIDDNSRVDDWLIEDFKAALKRSTENTKMNMQQSILYYKDDTREAYIQYHQQALIRLAAHLTRYGTPNPAPPSIDNSGIELLCYYLLQALEDLLSFVEIRYTKYIDKDTWLPESYLSLTAAELHSELGKLHLNLLGIGTDRALADIILQPFWKFAVAQTKLNGNTYSLTHYLKHLKLELEKIIKSGSSGAEGKAIHSLLISMDFNLTEYFIFCTHYMQQELKKAEWNDYDQLYLLSTYNKFLHQVPAQSWATLDASKRSLIDQLSEWIRVEREHIEVNISATIPVVDLPGTAAGFRIIIGMTIGQLSYFISVLKATGLIQNKNKSALSRFVITIFQTTGKEGMAKNSVRKNLYSKDDSVRLAVREFLIKCIAYIDADIKNSDG